MTDLREKIAYIVFGADGSDNFERAAKRAEDAADRILAIPEIAEALAMKRTVDGIKAGRLDLTPPQA